MSSSSCHFGESDASLPSAWVEDFLIEFYLENSSGAHSSCEARELHNENEERFCADRATELQNEHEERLCADGATELHNEQEKRLCVDSGSNGEVYGSYAAQVEPKQTSVNLSNYNLVTILEPYWCHSRVPESLTSYHTPGLHSVGTTDCLGEASEEDEKMLELWQAQYGQVVRSDVQAEACPRPISLWNWTTLVSKGKCKNEASIRLLGQLAQTSSRLHNSLQHHNGFIKTSHVCEVDLDLVKVISGEIFRLRQPSSKYLSSVALYDSSNPTKDWNFPCITFSGPEEKLETASKLSPNFSVMKPFIPNWNHQRYHESHESHESKVASLVPAGLRALSKGERASVEERKRKYRDRAKERREHYGDDEEECKYDIHHTKQELIPLAKETDDARKERSIGRHLLQRMGWSEGESIGKRKDGLIRPLDAAGNCGRAGIGWLSSRDNDRIGHHG